MFGKQIGDFQMPQLDASVGQPLQMPAQPAAKAKGGMFGSGGAKWADAIQAALAGYLASRGNPAGMAGLQMLQQKRQQAMQEQQYQQRRGDDFNDWVKKQAYQAANPSPVNNDTVADYNFWKGVLPPEKFDQYIENKVVNPPQYMNIPGVGLVQMPSGGLGQPGPAAAPGVTFTPMDEGGPMPQASGGFPRPY